MTNIPSPRHRETQTQHTDSLRQQAAAAGRPQPQNRGKGGVLGKPSQDTHDSPLSLCLLRRNFKPESLSPSKESCVIAGGVRTAQTVFTTALGKVNWVGRTSRCSRYCYLAHSVDEKAKAQRSGASRPWSPAGGEASFEAMMGLQGPHFSHYRLLLPARGSMTTDQIS